MGELSSQIGIFVRKAEAEITQAAIERLEELFGRIVDATPVDSGRARGNWICSIGSPARGESGSPDRTGARTKAKIHAVLSGVKAGDAPDIFFVNNTPYIEKLEYGASEQSPSGMVRLAVQMMEQKR